MKNQLVHIATLCHSGDCCPEIFIDPAAAADSCIVIHDDYQNRAAFGPDSVLTTPLRRVDQLAGHDGPHGIHGPFDEWIYMTPAQHHMLFSQSVLERIGEQAERHSVDLSSIAAQLQQIDPSMRFSFH